MQPQQGAFHQLHRKALRSLLWRLKPKKLQPAVERFELRIHRAASHSYDVQRAFDRVYGRARGLVIARLLQKRIPRIAEPSGSARRQRRAATLALLEAGIASEALEGPDFHCDAALGGLARWLRAWGYDARWWPGIDDDDLVRHTLCSVAILLTTDTRLMSRGVIKHGIIPALVVPISLKKFDQFRLVQRTLGLSRGAGRCMQCGGELRQVAKEAFRSQIPPRTYPWLDTYYQCVRCAQLFWHGTHWDKIEARLAAAE